jgi:NADP-dependent 3-hydroxy acid dehydrogenase YdfG
MTVQGIRTNLSSNIAASRSDTQTPRRERFMPQSTARAHPLVMITGASSGIGKALALSFAREGNPLLLISRHIEPIAGLPASTAYRQADVADFAAIAAAVEAAEAVHGPVECLVNNAGMADARAFDEVDEADYTRELDTNLKGVFNGTKAVLPGMKARQSGTIINISLVSDRKTAPVALAYTASKHAVRAFGESLREAEGKNGIRVINIAPGYIRTNIHSGMHISFEEYRARLGNPDLMTAEALAEIVLFCWKQPPSICIRDLVVAPTRTSF